MNETVTQAELFPHALPVTQTDTRAQRRAGSGAAEGAGARAAAQPSLKAASHPAALHLRCRGERSPEASREQVSKKLAAEAESAF